LSQIIDLLPIIIFPIAFVIGGLSLFRGIYFLVKALQNTADDAFTKAHTKFNRLNVLWVANCLNSDGKIYRQKALRHIAIFIVWSLLFVSVIQIVGA
jgi:hypothetical protein